MELYDVSTQAEVEERHWWFRERRHLIASELQGIPAGLALDVGAAGGGNTVVLTAAGWRAVAVEYLDEGARLARGRGLEVVRGDAMRLPFADAAVDLVVAYDVLEHLADDQAAARELCRVLRPGGLALVAVPVGPDLWSAHDEATGHYRRYDRRSLLALLTGAGLQIESARSWNVLMRPAVKLRRARTTGSDVDDVRPALNRLLGYVIALERVLPVGRLPGVSMLVRARRATVG